LVLAELAEKAGIPLACSTWSPRDHTADVGKVMCESDLVRHFSFTGSTEIGKKLGAACVGSTVKKVSLELGGNAPLHCVRRR
jgi:succinate-semialdehyde dehydrogenase/glutarate-semialdehyde dehydrogenase